MMDFAEILYLSFLFNLGRMSPLFLTKTSTFTFLLTSKSAIYFDLRSWINQRHACFNDHPTLLLHSTQGTDNGTRSMCFYLEY